MIHHLPGTWKITAACLKKYLPVIKMEGARKLLRQFELSDANGSRRKIDNREKYSNAAIKKIAEKH